MFHTSDLWMGHKSKIVDMQKIYLDRMVEERMKWGVRGNQIKEKSWSGKTKWMQGIESECIKKEWESDRKDSHLMGIRLVMSTQICINTTL